MRRVLIILGVVVVAIAAAALIWFLFFRSSGGVTATPGTQFPGGGDPYAGGEEPPDVGDSQNAGEEFAPHLTRITPGPVALGSVITLTEGTKTLSPGGTSTPITVIVPQIEVRYIDRASGNVYAYLANDRTLTRLSNRTVPGVQEAAWLPDASVALARYIGGNGVEETYVLPATGEDGYALERGLSQAFVSGSSTIVTLLSGTNGTIVTSAKADGTGAKTVFTSVLSSLRAFVSGTTFAAATKASSQSDGYAFLLRGGTLERILGPLKGLTILPSPSGKTILYTYLSGTSVKSALYDTTMNTATPLPVIAMPDKCTWSVDETSVYCGIPRTVTAGWPDNWYQGTVNFTDRIWRIDLGSRLASLVVDPKVVANVEIDAVALTIDVDADVLVFTNKSDGSLWMYDL